MKRSLIIITALVAFLVPAICSAAPPRIGPYVSGFAGISIPSNEDATTTDFDINQTFSEKIEYNPGIYLGGTGGFDFGFVRLEGELSYRYSEIDTVTDNADGFQFHDVDGNVGVLAVMANAFVDLHNPSPITPYFGGGIGFAVLSTDDITGVDSRGNVSERILLYPEDNDTVFAYQIGAGVEIALNPMISLDVGYRYFETDEASLDNGFLNTRLKFRSHNAMVGVRVKF